MNWLDRMFAGSAVALCGMVLLWTWHSLHPEWLQYQKQYRQLAADFVASETARKSILEEEIGIKQLNLAALGRVDRCITCHRGYDRAEFAGVAQPLTYHAQLLDAHPPEKFGCTVCHGGQGRATTKEGAFGRLKHWHEPLLDGAYVQASCGRCHFESSVDGAPYLMMGKQLYRHYGCINCHKLYKRGGTSGPDLTEVASKQSDQFTWGTYEGQRSIRTWLGEHFRNSQNFDPNSKMANYEMTEENAKALTIYMLSLGEDRYPADYYVGTPPWAKERSAE